MKTKWNNWISNLKSKWKKGKDNNSSNDSNVEVKKMNSKQEFSFPGANHYGAKAQPMRLDQVKNFYARYEARSYRSGNTFYIRREMISFQ